MRLSPNIYLIDISLRLLNDGGCVLTPLTPPSTNFEEEDLTSEWILGRGRINMSKKETEKTTAPAVSDSSAECAIIAADLHLKKKAGLWAARAEIAGDDEYALEQICNYAIEHKADLYLLGDVFDCVTNLPRPMVLACKYLSRVIAAGLKVRYIQGNHEIVSQAHFTNHPWMSLVPEAEHMSGKTFDFLGYTAYAIDYFPNAFASLEMAKVPDEAQILFLHGTVDTVMELNYHIAVDDIPENVDYVFAGDWHEAASIDLGDGRHMYYPGSTYMGTTAEPLDKLVYLVDRDLNVKPLELKTRTIIKYSEHGDAETIEKLFASADETMPKEIQKGVVIIDQPVTPDVIERLARTFHIYTTAAANPDMPSRDAVEEVDKLSDADILSHYIDHEEYPDEFDFTLDVIQNGVDDAFMRLKKRIGLTDDDVEEDNVDENTETIVV